MSNNTNKFYDAIDKNSMTASEVADLFLNYHGTQLITSEFIEFVEDEGYLIDKE